MRKINDFYYATFTEVVCPDCDGSVLAATKMEARQWAKEHRTHCPDGDSA